MTDTAREFDVVLFGATGAARRVTARHLAATAKPHLRIALAGRSLTRLQSLTEGLGEAAGGWPMVALDATDEDAVRDLAGRTRVVVTTVGPYVTYGAALLAACAEAGTDYCDITGEVLFVHRAIAAHHETARRTGARIVPACGFDSVPSDLGVLLTAEAARADGARLGRTRLAVRSLRGSLGGGTVDTVRTQVDEVTGDTRRGQRPLHGAVRHGRLQHEDRRPLRLTARLRAGLPLRRVHRLRRRPRGCRDGGGDLGRPPGSPGRHGVPPDPPAPR